jgi:Uma2 family endonuclease
MSTVAEKIPFKPQFRFKIPRSQPIDFELPLDFELPTEDGEPLESNSHRMAMTALIQSLKSAWAGRKDFFVGGNMFVYFSPYQITTEDYRGPDFFVVLDAIKKEEKREVWKIWEEGGRKPNMVVELLSRTTKSFDLTHKKYIYEQILQTEDYFVYDPLDPTYFRGWHLDKGHYQELQPNNKGWLWSNSLGLWVGRWEGKIEDDPYTDIWLRFYDQDGQLLLLPSEKAQLEAQQERQRADQERLEKEKAQQRAEKLAALLRAQGINIEDM